MHVMHVINRLAGSGAETSLRDILLGTSGANLRHTLVVLHPEGNRLDGVRDAGIDVMLPDGALRNWPARIGHVRRALIATRPDLVHTTLFEADVAGRIAARWTGTPCVTSLVNTPYDDAALRAKGASRWKTIAVRSVDRTLSRHVTTAFHAITDAAAEAAVRDLRIDRDRIHVVPRGRDATRLGTRTPARRKQVRDGFAIAERRPVVVAVARQEPQKGLVDLVQAMATVAQQVPDALLLHAGREGNSTRELRRLTRQLGLDEHVRWLGRRSDVGDLLAAADVFAFPSRYEGLGGAVLEAMAVGAPIVASDIPALREVLDDGRCGALVPPSSPAALAAALIDALTDRASAEALAGRARRRFDATYDLDICLRGMRELYARVASLPPASPRQDSTWSRPVR